MNRQFACDMVLLAVLCCAVAVAAAAPAQNPAAQCSAHPGTVTAVRIQALRGAPPESWSDKTPVTFGQVFAPGDLPDPSCLHISLANGTAVPFQVDSKALHADGSLRHAVLTVLAPLQSGADATQLMLLRAAPSVPVTAGAGPQELLAQGFSAGVKVVLDGVTYRASADTLLRTAKASVWLSGPLVNEWQVWAPLKTADGSPHPNLSARFAIRSYSAMKLASVDVMIENDWAYAPAPQNYVYDVEVDVGGVPVYAKAGLRHYHHARWRKVFWWGSEPKVSVQHDTAYLIATKAVPNYDQSIRISQAALRDMARAYSGAAAEPMGNGLALPYMPTTGGRPDIGLLPGWAVCYLLSMDAAAKAATLGTGDKSGSWSVHYRNQKTNRPVSLLDYPYMSLVGHRDITMNPKTRKLEAFPECGGDCKSPLEAESVHEPAMSYLPYLVTGDYYYLEELQFWTMYGLFHSNPEYRDNIRGLIHPSQVRQQAWTLRDLSYAAYITPDSDPLKKQFDRFMSDNLDWYNATYQQNGRQPNSFGALVDVDARNYMDSTGIAPWQDDFFTAAVGRAVELGYTKAKPLLAWKAQFSIKRMTDPGFCWITGASYNLKITDHSGAPPYKTMAEIYLNSNKKELTDLPCGSAEMAFYLKLKTGEMTGYSKSPTGFPSNMQPALALSAQSGASGGNEAWKLFMSRSVQPDYSEQPQFAIIPRE